MNARCRTFHVLAVVAWAVCIACLLWLPLRYLMPPAGVGDHRIGLLGTLLLTFVILMGGWAGFRSICAFFHADE
ncbi:hypothetical protein [Massilia sp. METH4]|uniref:hypothetical protein n=1 Tax=Massilia sp. METH4 TaxID=3123041 RepID=UPI0030D29B96